MALAPETKKKIATLLKIKEDEFETALKDEKEIAVEIPEVKVFTDAELTTRDEQTAKDAKAEGEKEARKVLIKEVGKKMGFEPKGERIGDLVNELNEKMNASGDDKLKDLQKQVELLTADKTSLEELKTKLETEKAQLALDYEVIGDFPANRASLLNEREYLSTMRLRGIEIKQDGVYRNGELMRDDKTKAALPRKDALNAIFTENKWVTEEGGSGNGGRGGGNSGGAGGGTGGVKTRSQAVEQWKALNPQQNTNSMSAECMDYVNGIAAQDPTFDMYN